jgi:prepilin peptidase CpaA
MTLPAMVQMGCLAGFASALVLSAWQDVLTLRIANVWSLAVVVSFGGWAMAGVSAGTLSLPGITLAVGGATALFGVATLAFAAGIMGGADVKLLATSSLFCGPTLMMDFLGVTALTGGIVAVGVVACRRFSTAPMDDQAALRFSRVPYGPAIAAGGLWIAALRLFA